MTSAIRTRSYLLAVAVAALVWGTVPFAQTVAGGHDHQQPGAQAGGMMDHGQMAAKMAAQQKKLDDLVAEMNTARGNEKIDRIAAVVNALAAAQKEMNEMCAMMHDSGGMKMGEAAPAAPALNLSTRNPHEAHQAHVTPGDAY